MTTGAFGFWIYQESFGLTQGEAKKPIPSPTPLIIPSSPSSPITTPPLETPIPDDLETEKTESPSSNKKRVCPDVWVWDKMPQTVIPSRSPQSQQYFEINGKRVEIKDYDLDWIRENCLVKKPQIVN